MILPDYHAQDFHLLKGLLSLLIKQIARLLKLVFCVVSELLELSLHVTLRLLGLLAHLIELQSQESPGDARHLTFFVDLLKDLLKIKVVDSRLLLFRSAEHLARWSRVLLLVAVHILRLTSWEGAVHSRLLKARSVVELAEVAVYFELRSIQAAAIRLELRREFNHGLGDVFIDEVDDSTGGCTLTLVDCGIHHQVFTDLTQCLINDSTFNHLASEVQIFLAGCLCNFLEFVIVFSQEHLKSCF